MTVCGNKLSGVCGACTLVNICRNNEIANLPKSNIEWMREASLEELAEWIAKQKCDGCNDEPYDDKHGTCKYCMAKKTEQVREWLKQPHITKG